MCATYEPVSVGAQSHVVPNTLSLWVIVESAIALTRARTEPPEVEGADEEPLEDSSAR